eukprot:g38221.t1
MDDVTVFCSDPQSVSRLVSISDQFGLASGAKINRGKSEAMFFGNWADRSFIPFIIRTDYLKVLSVWFGGAGACTNTWEQRAAKVRQKLGRWEHRFLSIAGRNLVIGCEATFVCSCIKLCLDPQYANTKSHYLLRFYLSPVLRRMGLASL